MISFEECFRQLPLIAILRGVRPQEVLGAVESLVRAGFHLIEIPLNSPDPFTSIELAADRYGDVALIGAGTVLEAKDVERTLDAKGRLIIAPNMDISVGEAAISGGATWAPGIATPTEAFGALQAGAHLLKIFPSEVISPKGIKAMSAVLPAPARMVPVGGITPQSMQAYVAAGASGFGLGSALYQTHDSPTQTAEKAAEFVVAARHLFES